MKKIRNLNLLLLFILLSGVVQAQSRAADEPFLTKSLSGESIREVYVRTSGGPIAVSGVSDSEARIEVYVHPSNNRNGLSKDEIQQRLDEDYELTVSVAGNKLTAIARPKDSNFNWKRALNISFKVFVPQNVSSDLKTSGGGITMTNLAGTHDFSTSGGGLNLDKLSGNIRGRTSGGGITLTNSKDEIDLSTSGGGIKAENCNGNLKLNTSGGPINLSGLQGTIKVSTSGGPIRGSEISGELIARTSGGGVVLRDLSCSVEAHTSGGNMNVTITELGQYVTVSNSGGNIHLELPGEKGLNLNLRGDKIKIDALNNFSGQQDEHRITGTVNGGGVPVEVRTSGSITLALE